MIYVTHDQVEAMTLADKIVVLKGGHIAQVGAPMDLYRDPDNKFVGGFIGSPAMNFLKATVQGGRIEIPALRQSVAAPGSTIDGQKVLVGLRPEHLTPEPGEALKVELTESLGGVSYAHLVATTGETMIVEERGDRRSSAGDAVSLAIEPGKVYVFDAKSELRLR